MADLNISYPPVVSAGGVTTASGYAYKRVLIRSGSTLPGNTPLPLTAPGTGWITSGDTLTWESPEDFVDNVSVWLNGVLQVVGSGSAPNTDVYFVSTPDVLAFDSELRAHDVVQVWKIVTNICDSPCQEENWSVRLDDIGGGVTYLGEAAPGSSTSEAVWRIQRIIEVGNQLEILWASGSTNFDQVWDDRLSLVYS